MTKLVFCWAVMPFVILATSSALAPVIVAIWPSRCGESTASKLSKSALPSARALMASVRWASGSTRRRSRSRRTCSARVSSTG
ncbi:hypothetical protein D3C78_1685210 [compost metagenome]